MSYRIIKTPFNHEGVALTQVHQILCYVEDELDKRLQELKDHRDRLVDRMSGGEISPRPIPGYSPAWLQNWEPMIVRASQPCDSGAIGKVTMRGCPIMIRDDFQAMDLFESPIPPYSSLDQYQLERDRLNAAIFRPDREFIALQATTTK